MGFSLGSLWDNTIGKITNPIIDGIGGIASDIAPILSFIPGWGQAAAPIAGAIGSMYEGRQRQNRADAAYGSADAAIRQQQEILGQISPYLLQYLNQDPYAMGEGSDPYSPTMDALNSGLIRGEIDAATENALSAMDFYNNQPGNIASSSFNTAERNRILNNAAEETARAEIAARLQGGTERYNNRVQGQLAKRQYAQQLAGTLPAMFGGTFNPMMQMGGVQQGLANEQGDNLAAAVEALAKLPKRGPRGGKTGSERGDNALGNNDKTRLGTGNDPFQMASILPGEWDWMDSSYPITTPSEMLRLGSEYNPFPQTNASPFTRPSRVGRIF